MKTQILSIALQGTVFIPTNEAFKFLPLDKINATISADMERSLDISWISSTFIARILGLHFLDQTIQTDDIRILEPQDQTGVSLPSSWPWNDLSEPDVQPASSPSPGYNLQGLDVDQGGRPPGVVVQ